jgi:exopolysaccharide production protein ExoQ
MRNFGTWLVLAAGLLWLSYTLHGFRPVWQPLVESDEDSGGAVRQVLFLGCAGIAWYQLLLQGKWRLVLSNRFAWVCLALLLGATAIYAERPLLTVKRSVVFACGLVLIFGVVYLPRDPIRFLLWGSVATVGILAWVSLLKWAALPALCWQIPSRPGLAGVAGHPNILGPALAIGWLLSLGIAPPAHFGQRVFLRWLQLGTVIALLLTDSIGSYGTAFVGSAVFVLMTAVSYWRAAMVLLLLFLLPFLAAEAGAISEALLNSMGRDTSLSGRDVLWAEIGREFFFRPWLGSGYGSFWYEGRGREIVGTWNPRQSHNAYLDLSLDLGLVGGLLVLGVVCAAMQRGRRMHRSLRCVGQHRVTASLLAVPLALLLVGAFSESYFLKMDKFQFFVLAWILLVLDERHIASVLRSALHFARV